MLCAWVRGLLFNCQKQFTNFITKLCASRINLSIRHPPALSSYEEVVKSSTLFLCVYICAYAMPEENPPIPRAVFYAFWSLLTSLDPSFCLLWKISNFLKPIPPLLILPLLSPDPNVCQRKCTRNYMYHTNFFIRNISSHCICILVDDKRPFVILVRRQETAFRDFGQLRIIVKCRFLTYHCNPYHTYTTHTHITLLYP